MLWQARPFKLLRTLRRKLFPSDVIVLHPDGVEPRGFHGKNALADQVRLVGLAAKTILDIGAHVGETTERYLELFPEATIHCFEPSPGSFKLLGQKFIGECRVKLHPLAVTDSSGPFQFHTFTNSVTDSLLSKAPEADRYVDRGEMKQTGVVTVDGITIDQICRDEGIECIDILKLDVQGGELAALRGATEMLATHQIHLIYTEVVFVPVYEGQVWLDELAAYLRKHRYNVFDFYNFTYAGNGQVRWGDAIFLPDRL